MHLTPRGQPSKMPRVSVALLRGFADARRPAGCGSAGAGGFPGTGTNSGGSDKPGYATPVAATLDGTRTLNHRIDSLKRPGEQPCVPQHVTAGSTAPGYSSVRIRANAGDPARPNCIPKIRPDVTVQVTVRSGETPSLHGLTTPPFRLSQTAGPRNTDRPQVHATGPVRTRWA